MDTTDPPAIRSIYDAGATRAERRYLFPGGTTRKQYEALLDTMPNRTDAIGLYQLYRLRGQAAEAQRYLAMMDEDTRRDFTMADLLLGDRPGADR